MEAAAISLGKIGAKHDLGRNQQVSSYIEYLVSNFMKMVGCTDIRRILLLA